MNHFHRLLQLLPALIFAACTTSATASEVGKPFEPVVGQQGKDVVWVPTPPVLVEKMLDVAGVTAQDYVIDLGSGDGRNIIAAARRGARALGVEYNSDMVELARRSAAAQGVADRALFMQGDMYEADISQATVMALFLLPENLDRLAPKFLKLKPGTRIVANHFGVTDWEPDEYGRAEGDCGSWCNWLLYIVPAQAGGRWRMTLGVLNLNQRFQKLTGTLTTESAEVPITDGRLRGDQIMFNVGNMHYTGRITADAMNSADGSWKAIRVD